MATDEAEPKPKKKRRNVESSDEAQAGVPSRPFSAFTGEGPNFEAGKVLSRSFSVFFSNFAPFTLISLLVSLPVIAHTAYLTSTMELNADLEGQVNVWFIVVTFGALVLNPIATAAVTYGVLQQLRGRHASFGECLRVGVSRMFHVLGVAIAAAILIFLGSLACVVPGIIATTALFVATPVAILERVKIRRALERSAELTRGYRFSIFGVIFVVGIINGGVTTLLRLIFLSGPGGSAPTLDDLKYYMIGVVAFGVLVEALSAVTAAVTYNDLRARKDGLDTDDIASVFD